MNACTDCRHYLAKRALCAHPRVYEIRARYGNGPLSVEIMRQDKPAVCGSRGDWFEQKRLPDPHPARIWLWLVVALVGAVIVSVTLQHWLVK